MTYTEYEYYIYETKKSDSSTMNDAFNFGLISTKGPDLDSCMMKVEDPTKLQSIIEYSKYKCVYVVKIPKMFLQPRVVDGELKQIPMPMWELNIDGTHSFKSSLIHGAYNKKIREYFPNKFYNEVYNPNGLQFDLQQTEYFKKHNLTRWVKFDQYRTDKPFYSLKNIDRKHLIWKSAMTQYTDYYNKRIAKKLDRRIVF